VKYRASVSVVRQVLSILNSEDWAEAREEKAKMGSEQGSREA